jgi:hypothetical protein
MNTGAQMLMGSISLLIVSLLTGELNGWDITAVSARSLYGLSYLITARFTCRVRFLWLAVAKCADLARGNVCICQPDRGRLLGVWFGMNRWSRASGWRQQSLSGR